MTRLWRGGLLLWVALGLGCGTDDSNDEGGPSGELTAVTYREDVRPILDSACVPCHASTRSGAERRGAPTGVDYDTYEAASTDAVSGNARVQAGNMPPRAPLDEALQSVFQAWVDAGTPE